MATRNVVLTDRQEKLVDALVSSGRYQNASEVLREGLDSLARDPLSPPSRSREGDVGLGLRTLHVKRPGRHLLLYKIIGDRVRVLRILHDSMDIARHLPPEE